ncbi:DMT family transporter [Brevibacillus laterosporus]|uniref:EamA family transporter n=1 Tax=Brevibacillus laterosporus TaxID=1465 RepID=A0AAP8Q8U0_BRELA|nr:DMT family transporter [Brevibacillus laterosporus]PPA91183.1 EamA family transporter [Brevibacillus laterosporus]
MNIRAFIQMFIAMTIFGSVGFFSVLTGLPALELVFIRCICATVFLGFIWVVTGTYKKEQWGKKELIRVSFCGIANLLNWIFLFKSFELISITVAISLYHLAPMIVLLVGSFIFREKLTTLSVLAISVCFVGTIFIIGVDGDLSNASFQMTGFLYAILAALFYALTMILGKSLQQTSVYATTFIQTALGAICLLPFIHYHAFLDLTTLNWAYAIITGIIHTGVVYLLFFDSVRKLSTRTISGMVFLDPAVAILLDVVIIGFRPSIIQSVGILFIFIGMLYTLKKPKQENTANYT